MTAGVQTRRDGRHAETTALGRALATLDVRSPHTGEPLTEAMLLGIGGGLGGGYWTFEFTGTPKALVIGMRHLWHQPDRFLIGTCERLGVPYTLRETGSAKAAVAHLSAALAAGRRPLVWVDLATLPYTSPGPQWEKFFLHVVGVRGTDAVTGTVLIDDRSVEPWPVSAEQLAAARTAITSNKHRLIVPEPPSEPLSLDRLRGATVEGIRRGVTDLLEPPIKNFGLPAFAKWADLVANRRQKKGWPTVFAAPLDLLRALAGAHHAIETNGTGGGAMRPLYAEFLDDAADVLARPVLRDLADTYRLIGRQWTAVADAALPESVPLLRQTRQLMVERERLFVAAGPAAAGRVRAIDGELTALEASVEADGLGLTDPEIGELLRELQARIAGVHAAEEVTAQRLRAALA